MYVAKNKWTKLHTLSLCIFLLTKMKTTLGMKGASTSQKASGRSYRISTLVNHKPHRQEQNHSQRRGVPLPGKVQSFENS